MTCGGNTSRAFTVFSRAPDSEGAPQRRPLPCNERAKSLPERATASGAEQSLLLDPPPLPQSRPCPSCSAIGLCCSDIASVIIHRWSDPPSPPLPPCEDTASDLRTFVAVHLTRARNRAPETRLSLKHPSTSAQLTRLHPLPPLSLSCQSPPRGPLEIWPTSCGLHYVSCLRP